MLININNQNLFVKSFLKICENRRGEANFHSDGPRMTGREGGSIWPGGFEVLEGMAVLRFQILIVQTEGSLIHANCTVPIFSESLPSDVPSNPWLSSKPRVLCHP